MQRVGVVGLGDMGSGLAKNLIAGGFETVGLDLSAQRMAAFLDLGGIRLPARMTDHGEDVVHRRLRDESFRGEHQRILERTSPPPKRVRLRYCWTPTSALPMYIFWRG